MSEQHELLQSFAGGLSLLVIAPPGTGKSSLLGSICELVPPEEVELICPKPREINSWLYRAHGLDKTATVFQDSLWMPAVESYEADGYLRLMKHLHSLYADESKSVVILDPLTDAVSLVSHDVLKGEKAETPKDLRDPLGYYSSIRHKTKGLVQTLVGLSSKSLARPKHVLVAIHAQPTKEEDIKGNATQEARGKGVEFFGDVLPLMEGSYRREIAGEFDIVCYGGVKHENVREGNRFVRKTSYIVQVTPDNEKHAKVALAPALAEKEIPNTMRALLEAIAGADARVAEAS